MAFVKVCSHVYVPPHFLGENARCMKIKLCISDIVKSNLVKFNVFSIGSNKSISHILIKCS